MAKLFITKAAKEAAKEAAAKEAAKQQAIMLGAEIAGTVIGFSTVAVCYHAADAKKDKLLRDVAEATNKKLVEMQKADPNAAFDAEILEKTSWAITRKTLRISKKVATAYIAWLDNPTAGNYMELAGIAGFAKLGGECNRPDPFQR